MGHPFFANGTRLSGSYSPFQFTVNVTVVLPCRLAALSAAVTVMVKFPRGVPPCRVGGGGGEVLLLPPPHPARNMRVKRTAEAASFVFALGNRPLEIRVANRPSKGSRMA